MRRIRGRVLDAFVLGSRNGMVLDGWKDPCAGTTQGAGWI